jgi:hypothetical protein
MRLASASDICLMQLISEISLLNLIANWTRRIVIIQSQFEEHWNMKYTKKKKIGLVNVSQVMDVALHLSSELTTQHKVV